MSVSHSAETIIGVKINTDMFTVTSENRQCKHDVLETHKFCMECGKPRVVKVHTNSFYDRELENKSFGRLKFTYACDSEDGACIFFGLVVECDGYDNKEPKKIEPSEIDSVKAEVALTLKELDIPWTEEQFGIWLVLSCS